MGLRHSSLTALAVGALALGTGCLSTDGKKTETAKKPDVMQPGVLPPPQETTRVGEPAPGAAAGGNGGVAQASATTPAPGAPAVTPARQPAASGAGAPIAKITSSFERKVVATDFAVGWQNRIAYLPDPTKSGRMSPGLAGQMFLFGGPKLEFAQADGVLTVDLVDDSPRPAGQPAATPERWQFPKEILRNLQTRDETFGKSYVLFLPWPSYKADITRVKISARYDPENGSPLFATPSTITLDATPFGTPVWNEKDKAGGAPTAAPGARPFSGSAQPFVGSAAQPNAPIPLGGGGTPMSSVSNLSAPAPMIPIQNPAAPVPMVPIPGAAQPIALPSGTTPMIPIQNGPIPIPGRAEGAGAMPGVAPGAPPVPSAPTGPANFAPPVNVPPANFTPPADLEPLTITLPGGRPQ